jgi:anaerobic selenocysteine-containing dehydrogenase
MKRREFVKILGSAVGGLAIPFDLPLVARAAFAAPDRGWSPGTEAFIRSTCTLCPGACGVSCRVVDGSLVSIRGNAFNPINRGGVCPNGMAGLQLLYAPDRIEGPRVREGGKGSGSWRSIGWDEAITMLLERVAAARGKTAFLTGLSAGSKADLVRLFMRSIGSDGVYLDDRMDAWPHVMNLMHGVRRHPAFDLAESDLICSFGSDFLGAWWAPLQAQSAYGEMMGRRAGHRGELIQFEHRLSRTGAQAAEWIPVEPGAYGAIALGMAYILIKEELYDHDFVERRTAGFEGWTDGEGASHIGIRDLILQFYHPEEVARMTGVDEETIIRLGKKFGEAERAIALGDYMASYNTNGLYALMAVHTLNLLKGNINARGGVTARRGIPLTPLPGARPSDAGPDVEDHRYVARGGIAIPTGEERIERFPERVLWESRRDVDLLFVYRTNPVFSQVNGDAFEEALGRVPFVVSFSSEMDETTRLADLVLPDHVYLEGWDDVVSPPTFPYPLWGVVRPVIAPLHDTRNTGDVLIRLIREMGGGPELPFRDMEELLKFRARGLYEADRGMVLDDPFEQRLTGSLQRRGWWIRPDLEFDAFWDRMVERGGWFDPFIDRDDWRNLCGHRDRRIRFFVPGLAEFEGNELAGLPHHESVEVSRDIEHPFLLVPYRLARIDGGEVGVTGWVLESSGPQARVVWDGWVELHPATAEKAGVRDDDPVWVESKRGRVRLRAKIWEGILEGILSVPVGLGHVTGSGTKVGENILTILEREHDKRSGLPAWQTTPVKIYRA